MKNKQPPGDGPYNSVYATRAPITRESDGQLEAPSNIIQSVSAAKAVYTTYRSEHLKRIDLYAQIEGIFAGNPPYDPVELYQNGLQHIANFNPLDGRSLYEKSALAYWNLLNETERLAVFELQGQDPALIEIADTISRHFNDVVRDWDSFTTQVNQLSAQVVKFGLSPIIWPDERDWRWRTIETAKFFVQDQALSDIDELTCVAVESIFTAQYLFKVYNEFKDAKEESPWDIDALADYLMYRANSTIQNGPMVTDVMDLQKRLQNGDLSYVSVFSDGVRLVSFLQKEYDGKITHYIFDRDYDNGSFLYFADRQYDSMDDSLIIFTASPGEFTLHSNRGLGHKIFSTIQAMMQIDCSIVDMTRMSSTPLIKSPATGPSDVSPIKFIPGVPTNIGMSEFIQNDLGHNITQLVGASQYLRAKIQSNTAASGDDPSMPDSSIGSISPTQARFQSYKEFNVLKNNIAHFYTQFDRVIKNMVIKLLDSKEGYPGYEYAKEWKERCIADGVPEEVFKSRKSAYSKLPSGWRVKASRVAGDGSTLARILGLESLQAIAPSFGPRESREYKRQWIMSTMGSEYVKGFLQDSDDVDTSAGGASLAAVENSMMELGKAPIFSPDNDQFAHAAVHIALANEMIARLQQGQATPVDAAPIFELLVPHLGEHVQAVQNSIFNRQKIDTIVKAFNQIQQYATFNKKNAIAMLRAEQKKAQEAEAQQQKVLTSEELKQIQVVGDERRKDVKLDAQLQRTAEANQTRAQIMKDKVTADAENERYKISLENRNKMIEDRSEAITSLNGETPAPYDIENVPTITRQR